MFSYISASAAFRSDSKFVSFVPLIVVPRDAVAPSWLFAVSSSFNDAFIRHILQVIFFFGYARFAPLVGVVKRSAVILFKDVRSIGGHTLSDDGKGMDPDKLFAKAKKSRKMQRNNRTMSVRNLS